MFALADIRVAYGEQTVLEVRRLDIRSGEVLLASEPELLLVTDEHSAAVGGVASVPERPKLAGTPAGADKRALTLPAIAGAEAKGVVQARYVLEDHLVRIAFRENPIGL